MRKNNIIKIVCVVILCCLMPIQAFAQTLSASGVITPAEFDGFVITTYNYKASIRLEKGYAVASCRVDADRPIQPAEVAILTEIYNGTGKLLKTSELQLSNNSSLNNFIVNISVNSSTSMYCKGRFQFIDGERIKVRTLQTATGMAATRGITAVSGINQSGLKYGSGLWDEDLDLILVEGNNGNEGYVYAEKLYGPQEMTTEEFYERMEELTNERVLPVFEKDGITVIDSFKVGE